jgi:hypothetical protein
VFNFRSPFFWYIFQAVRAIYRETHKDNICVRIKPYKLRSQNARGADYYKTAVAMVDDFKAQGNTIFVSSTLFSDIY